MKRKNLKLLRIKHDLTQEELAKALNISLSSYNLIENGERNGSIVFWNSLQDFFKLTGEEIWNLQNNKNND